MLRFISNFISLLLSLLHFSHLIPELTTRFCLYVTEKLREFNLETREWQLHSSKTLRQREFRVKGASYVTSNTEAIVKHEYIIFKSRK